MTASPTQTTPRAVHFDDLTKELVGQSLGTSAWRTLTQDKIDAFASLTEDEQWIHVDPVRAGVEGPFGSTIAHGYMTLCLSTALLADVVELQGAASVLNYGVDGVRFTAAVPVDSRVRARISVGSVRRRGAQFTEVIFHLDYELEGSDTSPCKADVITLISPAGAFDEDSEG